MPFLILLGPNWVTQKFIINSQSTTNCQILFSCHAKMVVIETGHQCALKIIKLDFRAVQKATFVIGSDWPFEILKWRLRIYISGQPIIPISFNNHEQWVKISYL